MKAKVPALRPNPVRATLREGGTSIGLMAFEFFTPGLPPVLAAAGAEFVILDMEHSGVSTDVIKAQIAACKGAALVPMVRVPGSHYHLIAPVLDAGAMGIMVPMVETAEQARRIAAWCRYRPEGVRGLGFSVGHDDYAGGDPVAKMEAANARTLVIALVETATGIDNVDAIAAVPGIDVVWLGHYDLTATMGITAQFEHPRFLAAVDKLSAACRRHGKAPGFLVDTAEAAADWHARGFRCLCYGTDVGLLRTALAQGIAAARSRIDKSTNDRRATPARKKPATKGRSRHA
ncbi:MAG: aldolase [Alphaproteobacteria bacterium]|nr:aldolase [Alphaproteobacteria bacterium]